MFELLIVRYSKHESWLQRVDLGGGGVVWVWYAEDEWKMCTLLYTQYSLGKLLKVSLQKGRLQVHSMVAHSVKGPIFRLSLNCSHSTIISCAQTKSHTFPFWYLSLRLAIKAASVTSSRRMKSGWPNSAGSLSAMMTLYPTLCWVCGLLKTIVLCDGMD